MFSKMKNLSFITRKFKKSSNFNKDSDFIMLEGDTLKNIKKIPAKSIKLLITSPPYNLEKEYEKKATLENYLKKMQPHLNGLREHSQKMHANNDAIAG